MYVDLACRRYRAAAAALTTTIIRKVSNTLAGSALPLPPLTRSGRSSNSFQPTDHHMVAQPGKEEAKKHLKFVESEDEDGENFSKAIHRIV